jgi:hypothetical protein
MALMIISANLHDGPNDHFCFLIGISLKNWIFKFKNTFKILLEEYDKKMQISSSIKKHKIE